MSSIKVVRLGSTGALACARTMKIYRANCGTLNDEVKWLWIDDSFDHLNRSPEDFEDKATYIAMNAVETGVRSPEQYPWVLAPRNAAT